MQVGDRWEETIFYRLATDQPAYEDVLSLGFRKCDLISKKEKQHCWQRHMGQEKPQESSQSSVTESGPLEFCHHSCQLTS